MPDLKCAARSADSNRPKATPSSVVQNSSLRLLSLTVYPVVQLPEVQGRGLVGDGASLHLDNERLCWSHVSVGQMTPVVCPHCWPPSPITISFIGGGEGLLPQPRPKTSALDFFLQVMTN